MTKNLIQVQEAADARIAQLLEQHEGLADVIMNDPHDVFPKKRELWLIASGMALALDIFDVKYTPLMPYAEIVE